MMGTPLEKLSEENLNLLFDEKFEGIRKEEHIEPIHVESINEVNEPDPEPEIVVSLDPPPQNQVATNNLSNMDFITPLKTGMPEFSFTEFGEHHYIYNEILGPDKKKTKTFAVFYNGPAKRAWGEAPESNYVADGLLSKEYSIVRTEPLARVLAAESNVNQILIKSSLPFHIDCILETNKTVSVFEDESTKLIFKMLSGIDNPKIDNLNTNVNMFITNSYNGTRSLSVKLILDTVGSIDNTLYNFKDFFSLSKRSYTIEHFSSNMKLLKSEVENTQNYIDSDFVILKSMKDNLKKPYEKILTFLKKEQRCKFESYWEMVPADFKSLFMLFAVSSLCLDLDYNIHQQQKMNVYLNKLIKTL